MVVHLFKHFYPENLCVFRLHRDKKIVYGCSTFIQFSSRSNHIFRYILYYDFVNSCAEGFFQKQNPKIRYDFLDPFAFFHHRDPFKKEPM